ncbi:MAG: YHYH protein [Halopseudomonas aestusnigri]
MLDNKNISKNKSEQLLERRRFMMMMGVLPATGFIAAATKNAWALSNQVEITSKGQYRYIIANGIPNHDTGRFPNRGNPNSIQSQSHRFRTPLTPIIKTRAQEVDFDSFGVAVNGVPFDPAANEFWKRDRNSGWRYEAMSGQVNLGLDNNNAHVQPNGAYHYHGLPTGLIRKWSDQHHSPVIGYAADGFPIYVLYGFENTNDPTSPIQALASSYQLKPGTRSQGGPSGKYDGTFVQDYEYVAGSGDLDDCNGRQCITPDFPAGTYAYFLTSEYPLIPRYFRGEPDASFKKRRRGPGGGPDGKRPKPRSGGRPPKPPFKL